MFDLAFSEIAIIAIVAVVVIGPKELPRALSTAGKWMSKARGVMNNFRTGLDAMVREADLQEMEKKWASDNDRIMREHPNVSDDEPKMEALESPPSSSPNTGSEQRDLPLKDSTGDKPDDESKP